MNRRQWLSALGIAMAASAHPKAAHAIPSVNDDAESASGAKHQPLALSDYEPRSTLHGTVEHGGRNSHL